MKALALFIEPAFDQFNLPCSFAFIKDRGVSQAIKRIQDLISQGQRFYFEADIIDFFGKVDRHQLWQMFSDRVRQKSLLPLLHQCFNLELEDLENHEAEFQDLFAHADSGIPQGGVLSPMLANFYLYHFDRRMLAAGFNLIRYADDFVVLCDSREAALRAHDFCKNTLKSLNLDIHALGDPDSKSRIGDFSKDGLTFLGLRFERKEVFPTRKVVERFKSKVDDILRPDTGVTLFKTLQRLTNLTNGWGKCYRSMRVSDVFLELDSFIKGSVESYLAELGFQLTGKNKRRQIKLLGVPSLAAMMEHSRKPVLRPKALPATKPPHISKPLRPAIIPAANPRPRSLPFPIT
jgi:RNA-directed DNA polymerase